LVMQTQLLETVVQMQHANKKDVMHKRKTPVKKEKNDACKALENDKFLDLTYYRIPRDKSAW
jgi:hypothetical protein